jgi:hypothetical protein
LVALGAWHVAGPVATAQLRAGAAVVDIAPVKLPVIVNGGFLEAWRDRVDDLLAVRCLVLADQQTTIAIAVVDSCMIPRDVCDRIKQLAANQTGIPTDRMLVAATHTHSAPSVMDFCLGSRRDDAYTEFLVPRIAQCIVEAHAHLQPAEAGWAVTDAPDHTHCRRWIRRPDRVGIDPFGQATVRAMMHPGYQNPDYLGPAGPVDRQLSLLSLRALDGTPICLLANYSMHYVGGSSGVSADYWGPFAQEMHERIVGTSAASADRPAFVAMMSQGTSGDLHWMDYSRPAQSTTPAKYAAELAEIAHEAYRTIAYRQDIELAMAQTTLRLARRLPDDARLAWARQLNDQRGDQRPRNQAEVYAEQAVWIHEHPDEELVLQAIRVGDLGITAIPNEVFGITGLKLKAQSPLQPTFNMELANGAAGYIPPPEQHALGGYTTWPARTAGLEVEAEPKIVDCVLGLLERVSGAARRPLTTDLYTESMRAHMRQSLETK